MQVDGNGVIGKCGTDQIVGDVIDASIQIFQIANDGYNCGGLL
jgi:hypothetical protein